MLKLVSIWLCCIILGFVPLGIAAEKKVSGQQSAPAPSGKEDKTGALLKTAEDSLKARKYKEALESVEQVLDSGVAEAIAKAKDLKAKILKAVANEAEISLSISAGYLKAGQFDEAKTKALEVIALKPMDDSVGKRGEERLIAILDAKTKDGQKKVRALLDAGHSYFTAGDYEAVIKEVNKVLEMGAPPLDPEIIKEGRGLLTKAAEKKWRWKLESDYLGPVIIALYWIFSFAILLGILKLVSRGIKWYLKTSKRLQIRDLQDNTKLGTGSLFWAALSQWRVRLDAAGEALRLEGPRTGILLGPMPKDKLVTALETLPSVYQANLAEMAKVFRGIINWLTLCPPWMSADFNKESSGRILAQVTLQRKSNQLTLVTCLYVPPAATEEKTEPSGTNKDKPSSKDNPPATARSKTPEEPPREVQDPEMIKSVKRGVTSLAYKILYLLADQEATVEQAEAADQLRHGMVLLNRYIGGEDFDNLERSLDIFRKVRAKWPRLLQAYLYEGLALGLRQDFEEAIRNFRFVKEQAHKEDDELLSERAAYNEAVVHLHKSTSEEVELSLRLLDDLTCHTDDEQTLIDKIFKGFPLKAMAYAIKAGAIARRPLFWRELTPPLSAQNAARWLTERQRQILHITQPLEDLLDKINGELNLVPQNPSMERLFPDWDRSICRRIQWAIHYAWGIFYLNCAIGILADPRLSPSDDCKQKDFLAIAREEFQECELLLPSRAETLAAMGTALLFSEEYEEARSYLEKAKSLNKHYEYAFYRLAQIREKQGDTYELIMVLREFEKTGRPRRIKEFEEMYKKYLYYPTSVAEFDLELQENLDLGTD